MMSFTVNFEKNKGDTVNIFVICLDVLRQEQQERNMRRILKAMKFHIGKGYLRKVLIYD